MEEQHQLHFHNIFVESFSIILSSKSLYARITLLTIFPLSLLFFAELSLESPNFIIRSEQIAFWFCSFKIAHLAVFLALSVASTSSVVLAVARRDLGFSEVTKVWGRLTVTLLWSLTIVLAYNAVALGPARVSNSGPLFAVYFLGFVCVGGVRHLGSVASVLEEDCCGVGALVKGAAMVRGRMVISVGVFLVLHVCFAAVQAVVVRFVVGAGGEVWWRIVWGVLCLFLVSVLTLLGLVVQSVVYLACRLDRDGVVDEALLASRVGVCLGDYAPLRSSDIHLDRC